MDEKLIKIQGFVKACRHWRVRHPVQEIEFMRFLSNLDITHEEYLYMRDEITTLIKLLKLRIMELEHEEDWFSLVRIGDYFELGEEIVGQWASLAINQAILCGQYETGARLALTHRVNQQIRLLAFMALENDRGQLASNCTLAREFLGRDVKVNSHRI